MADTPTLTDKQQALIHYLPAGANSLSDDLGISKSTVYDRVAAVRDKGVQIKFDRSKGVYFLQDEPKVRRVSTKHTGSKTREANNFITEVERTILRRLKDKDLIAPQNPTPGNEDMVLHFTDLHVGDKVEDENAQVIYDSEIAEDVVEMVTKQTLKLRATMGGVADYDTLHVCYGGDMVTNENIYDGQAFAIEKMLADQMTIAVNAMAQQIKTFAREFETVNVICQPGNHGKTRASGVSKQANMDLVCYRWLKDRLCEAGVQNVNFQTSEATWYKSFDLRGGKWKGWLTHGQDAQKHVDATAASARDWRGWLNKHGFDVGLRGHYHEARVESIMNGPLVIESPSPKPGGEFADRIGSPSVDNHPKRLATVFGSSDKRPMTWHCFVDDA